MEHPSTHLGGKRSETPKPDLKEIVKIGDMYQFPLRVLFSVMNDNSGAWTRAVAAQIRAERAASGKTQREVIADSGIPKSTYLRLESGERRADADQLAQIVAVLGLKLSVFFQRVEDRVETMDPTTTILEGMLSPAALLAVEQARAEIERQRAEAEEDDPPDASHGRTRRSA